MNSKVNEVRRSSTIGEQQSLGKNLKKSTYQQAYLYLTDAEFRKAFDNLNKTKKIIKYNNKTGRNFVTDNEYYDDYIKLFPKIPQPTLVERNFNINQQKTDVNQMFQIPNTNKVTPLK
jgi:hypothetical protein